MSVDRAKEFLLDATEDEATADKVQNAYLDSLVAVSGELGYDLSRDDLSIAIEEMSGLADESDVDGFMLTSGTLLIDSLTFVRAPKMGVIGNPLGLSPGFRPGRP
jgi:hypothetical protein